MLARPLPAALALCCLFAGCGGAETPIPEIPRIDDESMVGGGGETDGGARAELPTEGGPRVRLGRVRVPAQGTLELPGAACLEAVVYVEEGNLRTPADEDLPGGTLYRTQRATALVATEPTTAIVALSRPAPRADDHDDEDEAHVEGEEPAIEEDSGDEEAESDEPAPCAHAVMGDVVVDVGSVDELPNAGGKLKVRILIDREGGASFGSFAILEGDAGLDVPVHTHPDSAEALFIVGGDGTMILGDERFRLSPGQVVYVPVGVEHGYEAGAQPLRAYQVYGPPGPEQRFRAAPEAAQ